MLVTTLNPSSIKNIAQVKHVGKGLLRKTFFAVWVHDWKTIFLIWHSKFTFYPYPGSPRVNILRVNGSEMIYKWFLPSTPPLHGIDGTNSYIWIRHGSLPFCIISPCVHNLYRHIPQLRHWLRGFSSPLNIYPDLYILTIDRHISGTL